MSRLPSTGPSLLRHLRQAQRQALRQAQSSAFSRSGASVSAPGMLSSDDFDGVDRTHLGTSGWALGSFDGGPSYLVLNGLDVFAKLTAKDAELTAMQATLTAQQATLTTAVANIAAQLVSINALIGAQVTSAVPSAPGNNSGFNVGTSWGTKASTTIAVPTGFSQALVFVTGSLIFEPATYESFFTRCGIAGNYGVDLQNAAAPVGSTTAPHSLTLTGLAGGTILLEVQAFAPTSSTAPANTAVVTGFAIFFR